MVPECDLRPGGSDACCAGSIAAAGVPCSATGGAGPCVLDGEASAYSLSGCDPIVCTTPTDLTGYTVTEMELSTATGFSVAAACADNYEGAAVVTPCTTDGPYALAGCDFTCTLPPASARVGYDLESCAAAPEFLRCCWPNSLLPEGDDFLLGLAALLAAFEAARTFAFGMTN